MSNTTNVVGYYNGNRWPIQLVISKLNITLTLEPGKYVLDRQGRKINDPYFEVFANNKQLHRETSETPVPVIVIPEVTTTVTSAQTNPVRAVTEWKRNERGIREPVLNQPAPATAAPALPAAVIASATASVQPMSIEEARRRGLVRKTRDVPEDYGVTDTTGLPPSGIPKMKYALDPGVNKPAAPLPKELLALPKDDTANPTRAQLVAGLAQGSATPAPEEASANPFANTAVVNAPPNSPIVAGTPTPQPPVVLTEAVEVAEPPVEEEPTFETEPESPLVGGLPAPALPEEEVAATPAPAPAAPAPAAPALRPITSASQFVCIACQAPFKWRSQLQKHAHQKHPERVRAIMAPYPEAPTT